MGWHTTKDIEEFLAAAGELLRSHPAQNTVLLTVTEGIRACGSDVYGTHPPLFGWWRSAEASSLGLRLDASPGGCRSLVPRSQPPPSAASRLRPSGAVDGAFVLTPPYPVLLSRTPREAMAPLADALAAGGAPVSAVSADQESAEGFAAAWRQRTGAVSQVRQRQRLYRLGGLAAPEPAPPGGPRVAGPADRDLIVAWYEAFGREAGEVAGNLGSLVDDRLGHGGLTLWEVDAVPVSLAGSTRRVAGMVRVGPVYTPPQRRRHGYAGAVTAAVSRSALDAGADEVLLFTDLANPTSNAIYQRLGYRPLHDRVVLSLST